MGKATDLQFGVRIELKAGKPKNTRVGQKGRGLRRVTYFYNFKTHFMSLERTNLEPSNSVCALIVRPTNQEMHK